MPKRQKSDLFHHTTYLTWMPFKVRPCRAIEAVRCDQAGGPCPGRPPQVGGRLHLSESGIVEPTRHRSKRMPPCSAPRRVAAGLSWGWPAIRASADRPSPARGSRAVPLANQTAVPPLRQRPYPGASRPDASLRIDRRRSVRAVQRPGDRDRARQARSTRARPPRSGGTDSRNARARPWRASCGNRGR